MQKNIKLASICILDLALNGTARRDVFDYIEMFYNPKRRHGTIGGVSPAEFERQAGISGN